MKTSFIIGKSHNASSWIGENAAVTDGSMMLWADAEDELFSLIPGIKHIEIDGELSVIAGRDIMTYTGLDTDVVAGLVTLNKPSVLVVKIDSPNLDFDFLKRLDVGCLYVYVKMVNETLEVYGTQFDKSAIDSVIDANLCGVGQYKSIHDFNVLIKRPLTSSS